MRKARRTLTTASFTFRGGAEHACCCACYGPVRGAAGFAFSQPVQIDDEGSLLISPFTGSLFLSCCLQRAPVLPCSLQGYRLRCLCPGRNAAWPQRAAASCFAQPRVGCGHDALQIRDLTELRRLVGACLKPALPKQNAESAKVPDQRSTTTRRYRPSGLQERVRRVVLHRIRDTHTILADQWRHECDANVSIIARDLSSARFIGARSASPASSTIAGLARRLPPSTAQAQPRARLDLSRGRQFRYRDDIGPHGIGPQLLARPGVPEPRHRLI